MDWKTKFAVCKQLAEHDDDIWADFSVSDPADAASVAALRKRLPNDYTEFLAMTDGADIAQCILCGTSNFSNADEWYGDLFDSSQFSPFGWDAGGAPLLFDPNGAVYIGLSKISRESPRRLAASFASFFNDVLTGRDYPTLFDEDPEDDEWYDFLCTQGWAL